MRKIHEPFSRMTETGDGCHSNGARVKKLDRKRTNEKLDRKELRAWGGGDTPGAEELRNQRIVMTKPER